MPSLQSHAARQRPRDRRLPACRRLSRTGGGTLQIRLHIQATRGEPENSEEFDVKSIHLSMFVDDTFTAAEKELLAERLERSEKSWRQVVA